MAQQRFECTNLSISGGFIQDNYLNEKISHPFQIIHRLNGLHEEIEELDKENGQLHEEIKEISSMGDKQARFIQMKGYTFKELIEFLKQERYLEFTKRPRDNTKRFENDGRIIFDNETKLDYIMSMEWEVTAIVELLNKLYEKNEAYKLREMTEAEYHKKYKRILENTGELIEVYESKLDNITHNTPFYMNILGRVQALTEMRERILNEI